MIIGCDKSSLPSNHKDRRNILLENIGKGNLSSINFEPNSIDVFTLGSDAVELMVKRKRLEFPSFSRSHLYSAVAYDEEYQYSIHFSHEKDQCLIYVNKKDELKKMGECYDLFNKCIAKRKSEDWDEDLVSKCSGEPICKNLAPLDTGSEIDKKYCDEIYGK